MPKVRGKEKILKAVKATLLVAYKRAPIRLSANSKHSAGWKGLARNIQSHEKHGATTKATLSSKAII